MSKALEYFEDMVFCNQLDYNDEKSKCDLIRNQLRAISCIENRAVFDIKQNKIVLVDKLIYIGDYLIIKSYLGFDEFKVDDYGKTWREVRESEEHEVVHLR
jgi:hypothetical protein